MAWCPKCKNEYREGFTVCADCGCELVESLDNGKKPVYYGSQEEMQNIADFLSINNICQPDITFNEKDATYELMIQPSEVEAVSKAMRTYFTKILADTQDANKESSETISEEEINESEVYTGVYEDTNKKAEDYRTGANTLLFVGGIGLLALILINFDIIPVGFAGFTKKLITGVMGTLFIIFLVLGISSRKSYKQLKEQGNDEQDKQDAIKKYLLENIQVDIFDKDLVEAGLSNEILYFRRIDKLKTMIQEYDPSIKGAFLDYIIEEVYAEIFE